MPRTDGFMNKETKRIKAIVKEESNRRVFHIPAKIKTVDDLLARDSVNALLERVSKDKANVTDMIILYRDADSTIYWDTTPDILQSHGVYMLEVAKQEFLRTDNKE